MLSDDEKRGIYDKHGEEGLKDGGRQHDASDIFSRYSRARGIASPAPSPGPGPPPTSLLTSHEEVWASCHAPGMACAASMFGGSFFNMHFGGGGNGEKQVPRGADVLVDLDVTLTDLYKGAFIEVRPTTATSVPVRRPARLMPMRPANLDSANQRRLPRGTWKEAVQLPH